MNFRLFGLNNKDENLLLSEFLVGVGQLKFRGTSVLFRLNKSIVDLLKLFDSNNANGFNTSEIRTPIHRNRTFDKGSPVKAIDYELATHTVKVKRSGALADITTLWDLDGIINYKFYLLLK